MPVPQRLKFVCSVLRIEFDRWLAVDAMLAHCMSGCGEMDVLSFWSGRGFL